MPSLSDASHAETCAGRWCNVMDTRATMHRVAGRRGWWCDRCYALVVRLQSSLPDPTHDDLLARMKRGLRT